MRPPEGDVVRKIVAEWVHKADQDIRAADAFELAVQLWRTLGRERERLEAERMLAVVRPG